MGQALYRKYRSKSLSELVGQEHISTTLDEAIKQGRISHAYLFTGPRGVGKTSTARILAYAINGLKYDEGQSHLDIIEIDAASNNSVEDIRDLREKVYITPTSGKYKVYIIDEVHMLSKAAFNAILKTLEEPPAHAVFILATTEAHKLPETIISRTQRFIFRPIAPDKAVKHLRSIADSEGIKITDDALKLLADHGDGSFRDSISLLDQIGSLGTTVDVAEVQATLGVPSGEAIQKLATSITQSQSDTPSALQALYDLYDQGFRAVSIASQLSAELRQQIIDGRISMTQDLAELLAKLLEVPISHDPERYLEILLLGLNAPASSPAAVVTAKPHPSNPVSTQQSATPPAKQAHQEPKAEPPAERERVAQEPVTETSKATTKHEKPKSAAKAAEQMGDAPVDETLWPKVLQELKKQYNTLYSIVRMANVRFKTPEELELTFAFGFHQKRVHEAKNRKIISDCIYELSGRHVSIECLHDPDLKLTKQPAVPVEAPASAATDSHPLQAIESVFGGAELLP